MAKPKSKKRADTTRATTTHRHHSRKKMRPSYCKYCVAKLPWNRLFCNKQHELAFKKAESGER